MGEIPEIQETGGGGDKVGGGKGLNGIHPEPSDGVLLPLPGWDANGNGQRPAGKIPHSKCFICVLCFFCPYPPYPAGAHLLYPITSCNIFLHDISVELIMDHLVRRIGLSDISDRGRGDRRTRTRTITIAIRNLRHQHGRGVGCPIRLQGRGGGGYVGYRRIIYFHFLH